MKNFYLVIILLLFASFSQNAVAQNISNEGLEFWTVFPTHDPAGGSLATMNVNITSKANSRVTVSCGSYSETKDIPANTVITFLVPRSNSYIDYSDTNLIRVNRGIHIVVASGSPKVVAYSHVYAGNRSAATLILPYDALGQKYFSMNYAQDNGGKNFMVFVAAEDNTNLILHKNDGTTTPITLPNKGDVYEYMPSGVEDLTGTFVEVDATSSCKRFAVFSGSTSVTIGCANSRDPLLQQLYAINSWGKTYGVVPFINRRYVVRVLAQEDNTAVRLNGTSAATLNKGQFFEQILTIPTIISADKLISVAEYSFTQNCSSIVGGVLPIGDPEMVLLNPVEFNIKNITVFSSTKNLIRERYINVFMKTAKTSTFRINGLAPNATWQVMPSDASYSYLQLQVYDESLTLTADEGFNAIAYGFGQTESYAYSAGTNLASSSALVLLNKFTGSSNLAACLGQETDLKLTVPYRLTKITWTFSDGTTFVDNSLSTPVISNDASGGQLFTYTSLVSKTFNTVGLTTIKAIAVVEPSTASSCLDGADLEFDFEVEVTALASPDFDSPADICLGSPITITDKSNGAIAKWKWQFDNDPPIEDKNPTYTFKTIGTHTIKLSVANAAGCWSDVVSKTINITKYLPILSFNTLSPICINDAKRQLNVTETLGLAASSKVFSGDGISANGLFDPQAAGVGIHTITYTFTSADGCISTAKQDIEVYALPIIKVDPIIYILAGGEKVMPAVIENPYPKHTYKWTPSLGLSKDDVLNPIASPDKDTEYQLSVTVEGMCEMTAKVLVKVLGEIKPPNSFSPNGDGINDTWNILSIDSYPNAIVEVFNRNGQKVFNSIGYALPFDGTFHNNPLPVGVYYYIINPKNGRKAITGSLTIIR